MLWNSEVRCIKDLIRRLVAEGAKSIKELVKVSSATLAKNARNVFKRDVARRQLGYQAQILAYKCVPPPIAARRSLASTQDREALTRWASKKKREFALLNAAPREQVLARDLPDILSYRPNAYVSLVGGGSLWINLDGRNHAKASGSESDRPATAAREEVYDSRPPAFDQKGIG
jgi:hypothetical protein